MAISPPSDIVLDVAKAAEPAGLQAARAALVNRTTGAAGTFSLGEEPAMPGMGLGRAPDVATPNESMKRFEAMVLQTFIENMMPKNTESVYGKGMAGDMWKSMMAEKLANVMAERGGIGIADRVLGDHYMDGENKVPVGPVSGGPGKAEIDEQTSLSTALVQDLQRKLVRDLAGDQAAVAAKAKI